MALKPQAIELHINELVLRGFEQSDRLAIGDAVERELARLIAQHGLAGMERREPNIERVDAGKFKVAPGARPHRIGAQVAGAVHGGISAQAASRGKPSQ